MVWNMDSHGERRADTYGWTADFSPSIVSIFDGHTIDVLHNGQAERLCLHGIDCPEKSQAW
jgi:endonuclease YncB( thermonuclease family)